MIGGSVYQISQTQNVGTRLIFFFLRTAKFIRLCDKLVIFTQIVVLLVPTKRLQINCKICPVFWSRQNEIETLTQRTIRPSKKQYECLSNFFFFYDFFYGVTYYKLLLFSELYGELANLSQKRFCRVFKRAIHFSFATVNC